VIVDTSALIAILRRESDATQLAEALLNAPAVRMSAAKLLEARIIAERDRGNADLDALIAATRIEVVAVDRHQIDLAFEGFLRFGKGRHPAALNLGDLFAYALARVLGEPLLFKGNDFARTDVKIVPSA
jgi:ribonuclease VapC